MHKTILMAAQGARLPVLQVEFSDLRHVVQIFLTRITKAARRKIQLHPLLSVARPPPDLRTCVMATSANRILDCDNVDDSAALRLKVMVLQQ